MVRPLQRIVMEERYAEALLLLAVFYLLGNMGPWMSRLADLIFIFILLLITANPAVPRPLRWTALIASAVSAGLTLTRLYEANAATVALDAISTLVVVSITIAAIMMRLVRHTEVDVSTVMGAFLCYALIAFAAAFLYIAVQAITGVPFFTQGPQPDEAFIYFSIVTLTTVGFGDLTAGTPLAQRLVAVEALVGQVFLVVLVSRLVSLWKPPKHGERLIERD